MESHITELDNIRLLISEFKTADVRKKRKLARRAAFLAENIERSGGTHLISDIGLLQEALSIGINHHDWPSKWQASKARLHLRKREILKTPEPITLYEKARTLDVEMGAIAVLDAAAELEEDFFATGSGTYKKARERGDFFDLSLGMDCLIKVRVRYIDCTTPELSSAEIRRLISATEIAFIKTDSKKIKIISGGKKSVEIETNFTEMLSSFYLVRRGKSLEIICVCCNASDYRPKYFDANFELFDN